MLTDLVFGKVQVVHNAVNLNLRRLDSVVERDVQICNLGEGCGWETWQIIQIALTTTKTGNVENCGRDSGETVVVVVLQQATESNRACVT